MRILPKDLPFHLKKGLRSLYCVWGEEPLQHLEALQALRAEAKHQGYTEREIYTITPELNWDYLEAQINTLSLFSAKRLIECRLPEEKGGKGLEEAFKRFASYCLPEGVIVVVIGKKLESTLQKSKAFLAFEQKCDMIVSRALSHPEMNAWIQKRASAQGLQISPEGVLMLVERTEGNLLATAQTLDKLALRASSPLISTEDIQEAVSGEAHFTVFELVESALSGSPSRTTRILASLEEEGLDPILVLWALAKETRTLISLLYRAEKGEIASATFSQHGIWKSKEGLIRNFIRRTSLSTLEKLILKMKTIDDIVKGKQPGEVWSLLKSVCHTLTGAYAAE